jgi:hypothetical protein
MKYRPWSVLLLLTMATVITAAKCDKSDIDRVCAIDPSLPVCAPKPSPTPGCGTSGPCCPFGGDWNGHECVYPSPSPVASPTPPPTTQPEPDPSPSPSATPSPATSPAPSPMPSLSPGPTPPPSPEPAACTPHPLPSVPVPLLRTTKPSDKGWVCDTFDGHLLCAGRTAVSGQDEWRTPSGDDCLRGSIYMLQSHNHEGAAGVLDMRSGLICRDGEGRDCSDAFCRRVYPDKERLVYPPESPDGWEYSGNLPPVFCETAPPSPAPSPSATPPPGPTPQPTPAACPPLRRWSTSTPAGEPGSRRSFDSTPRFGNSANGLPCNDDHHAVCSLSGDDHGTDWRHCEDPRGGAWTVRGDLKLLGLENPGVDGLGFRANVRGSGQIQVCPPPHLVDEEGKPVAILGDGCSGWKEVP